MVIVIIFIIILALLVWGIVTLITESSNLLKGLNNYIQLMYDQVKNYIGSIKTGNTKLPMEVATILENSSDKVVSFYNKLCFRSAYKGKHKIISEIPTIAIYTFITLLATYFICIDKIYIADTIEHQLPHKWAKKIGTHTRSIVRELEII